MKTEIQNPHKLMEHFISKKRTLFAGLMEALERRHGDNLVEAIFNRTGGISIQVKAYDGVSIDNVTAWVERLQDSHLFVASGFYLSDGVIVADYRLLSEEIARLKKEAA